MAQTFISHSKYDKDIRDYFDRIFAGTGVRAVRLEFEQYEPPASEYIMNQIRSSAAIFILLGPNITRTSATQSWVGFETGFGAGVPKDIWVFEPIQHAPIKFPVPLLHHYVLYNMNSLEHRNYLTKVVKAYDAIIPLITIISLPRGLQKIKCEYDDCRASYHIHTDVKEFYCPVCRRILHR